MQSSLWQFNSGVGKSPGPEAKCPTAQGVHSTAPVESTPLHVQSDKTAHCRKVSLPYESGRGDSHENDSVWLTLIPEYVDMDATWPFYLSAAALCSDMHTQNMFIRMHHTQASINTMQYKGNKALLNQQWHCVIFVKKMMCKY